MRNPIPLERGPRLDRRGGRSPGSSPARARGPSRSSPAACSARDRDRGPPGQRRPRRCSAGSSRASRSTAGRGGPVRPAARPAGRRCHPGAPASRPPRCAACCRRSVPRADAIANLAAWPSAWRVSPPAAGRPRAADRGPPPRALPRRGLPRAAAPHRGRARRRRDRRLPGRRRLHDHRLRRPMAASPGSRPPSAPSPPTPTCRAGQDRRAAQREAPRSQSARDREPARSRSSARTCTSRPSCTWARTRRLCRRPVPIARVTELVWVGGRPIRRSRRAAGQPPQLGGPRFAAGRLAGALRGPTGPPEPDWRPESTKTEDRRPTHARPHEPEHPLPCVRRCVGELLGLAIEEGVRRAGY